MSGSKDVLQTAPTPAERYEKLQWINNLLSDIIYSNKIFLLNAPFYMLDPQKKYVLRTSIHLT